MTKEELAYEVRKQRRLEILGTNAPRCGMCGEDDWCCIEAHHSAGCQWDDSTVLLCRNCHRKVTEDQKGRPPYQQVADPLLDQIGRFLLGLADMLRIIVERLVEFGNLLIERACFAPQPLAGDRL